MVCRKFSPSAGVILGVSLLVVVAGSLPAASTSEPCLVPWPRVVTMRQGSLSLTPRSRIALDSAALAPLAQVLAEEIQAITGLKLATTGGKPAPRRHRVGAGSDGEGRELSARCNQSRLRCGRHLRHRGPGHGNAPASAGSPGQPGGVALLHGPGRTGGWLSGANDRRGPPLPHHRESQTDRAAVPALQGPLPPTASDRQPPGVRPAGWRVPSSSSWSSWVSSSPPAPPRRRPPSPVPCSVTPARLRRAPT